ncbi:hypothetical protein SK803_22285 [Lentzea sp. BCCO 10_0856]|uniref:Lipoprotein n=1 Tax=Lentzea miocenica TaxID=3095431 RepID=A0ABU4T454_9PSEU|nr:hypothetical protein [Lentzea sp. BCCO 10_0856]MDX8032956.1 hypothetical protein [Lentzea sp. BCCO 10_0856]
MRTITTLLLTCCALTACAFHRIEADPTFLVIDVGETTYDINVTSGRPDDLRADNWHRSVVDKAEFETEVQKGDHVVCHLTETDAVRITNCRKSSAP